MTQNTNQSAVSELLRVTGLAKSYGGLKAVDDISFEVYRGEILALVGDNRSQSRVISAMT